MNWIVPEFSSTYAIESIDERYCDFKSLVPSKYAYFQVPFVMILFESDSLLYPNFKLSAFLGKKIPLAEILYGLMASTLFMITLLIFALDL